MPRLPTLKSLQAFEAVARNLSFKKAAEELNVTPTALSHQVKHLEDQLGVALFHRLTRSIKLTAEGKAYAPQITAAFGTLAAASSALDGDRLDGTLTVTTTSSFASSWLSPRMKDFRQRYPGISVRLLSSDAVAEFRTDEIDLAIRFAAAPPPNMQAIWLLDDYVTPVCAPERAAKLGSLDALLDANLIQYEWQGFSDADPSWQKWLAEQGQDFETLQPFVTYSEEHIALLTAVDDHGVALCSLIAAARYLEEGKLVAPFDFKLKNKSYYLVSPDTPAATRKRVEAFRNWLLEEVEKFRTSDIGHRYF